MRFKFSFSRFPFFPFLLVAENARRQFDLAPPGILGAPSPVSPERPSPTSPARTTSAWTSTVPRASTHQASRLAKASSVSFFEELLFSGFSLPLFSFSSSPLRRMKFCLNAVSAVLPSLDCARVLRSTRGRWVITTSPAPISTKRIAPTTASRSSLLNSAKKETRRKSFRLVLASSSVSFTVGSNAVLAWRAPRRGPTRVGKTEASPLVASKSLATVREELRNPEGGHEGPRICEATTNARPRNDYLSNEPPTHDASRPRASPGQAS